MSEKVKGSEAVAEQGPRMRPSLSRGKGFDSKTESSSTDPSAKKKMLLALMLVCTMDVMGEFLMAVCFPFIMLPVAPGVQLTQDQIDGGYGVFAEDAVKIGTTIAMNLGPQFYNIGQFFSSICSGYLAKLIGKRRTLMLYTLGGAIGMLLAGLSKDWGMWPFFMMRMLTGCFGGSMVVVSSLIIDLSDGPEDQEKNMGQIMGPTLIMGVVGGPVIGNAIKGSDNTRLFWPLYIGAISEVIAFILVLIFIHDPPKKEDGADTHVMSKYEKEVDEEDRKQKHGFQKFVGIFWVACALDTSAQVSMLMLNNVGFHRFPWTFGHFQEVMILFSVIVLFVIPTSVTMTKFLGYAYTALVGQTLCAIAIFVFYIIATNESSGIVPFMLMFYITPLFNQISGMNKQNIISGLVPKGDCDRWLGYMDAFDQFLQAIAPFLLVKFLQDEEWGPYPYDVCTPLPSSCVGSQMERFIAGCPCVFSKDFGSADTFKEGSFLLACGIVTIVSCIPYSMLIVRFPIRRALQVVEEPESEKAAMKAYRENGDITWLTARQFYDITMENLQQGGDPLKAKFGNFEDDKPDLDRIMAMASSDVEFWLKTMQDMVVQWQKGGDDKQNMIKMLEQGMAQPCWSEDKEACDDFFNWVRDYMVYAGYDNPQEFPRGWKAIIMTMFPRMGIENGSRNPKYLEDPVPMLQAGERFMRGHLALLRLHSDVDGVLGSLRTYRMKFTGMI